MSCQWKDTVIQRIKQGMTDEEIAISTPFLIIDIKNTRRIYESKEKPTIGVMPKYLWDENRVYDIIQAMHRKIESRQEIPIEWVEEYNDLIE